ncbi:alpha/beta hydrolase [Corynebacterium sp. 320]|uniref:Alpha/beta hydrolase n=1 Tax=Corynebacterium zhongnanshanii TaxID=2768834 RepID=A0ABQ6VHU9_9CORY|nr:MULTISPECIES: alpha/beta fold hydrolase [Corynebacterium]KAB1503016.1 alpha/beta hydrolase [Corynebacterium sp. 320]KAB1550775.1 alpha/beta hydrolase [Corynebacterium sp. 321]KAB1551132.1 alpha/beta hydrolase [Corynebacterium sp. 319]KAB3519811.1 alpha/beta hydrolase [Corynebacterium zhongnanshanii]KAB3526813.1 alpha/beta hydrolase [Corynebacterium sp. 250]
MPNSFIRRINEVGHWEESPDYPVSPSEPRPVVVIHGTVGGRGNFARLVPYLRSRFDGRSRRVFSVSYGDNGTTHLLESLEEIEQQLLTLQSSTKARSFDVVAHSQGGLQSLAVASRPTAGHLIHHIVGLGADFRGVRMPWSSLPDARRAWFNQVVEGVAGPAFAQQIAGSPQLETMLREVGDCTVPITQIATQYDRTVPVEAAFSLADDNELTGLPAHPGPLRLVLVQQYYPELRVAHNMLLRNNKVARMVKYALEHPPQHS